MMIRKGRAFCALVFALAMTLTAFGQGRRNGQQQQQPQAAPAPQGVGLVAPTKDESDAFNALQKEQAPDKKLQLADGLISKYPNSDFVPYAQLFRAMSLSQMNKPQDAVTAAQQAIDSTIKFGEKLLAKADADAKLTDKDKEAVRKKDKNA